MFDGGDVVVDTALGLGDNHIRSKGAVLGGEGLGNAEPVDSITDDHVVYSGGRVCLSEVVATNLGRVDLGEEHEEVEAGALRGEEEEEAVRRVNLACGLGFQAEPIVWLLKNARGLGFFLGLKTMNVVLGPRFEDHSLGAESWARGLGLEFYFPRVSLLKPPYSSINFDE
ncbi:hypothetical protein Tsubulata_046448 [Turnera subulata]|uniref:Uncharacterized protein n=1 Tax=Turnera subulata TaxID=218843 RepID=A0A9Q0JJJ4_9ROSI|nr:hypothetical protein Tsubulata_046448 [Turnera subulata]